MLEKENYNQGCPHEASEGHKAGLISIKRNKDAPVKSPERDKVYNKAHPKAIPAVHTSNYLFGIKINKNSPFKNVK